MVAELTTLEWQYLEHSTRWVLLRLRQAKNRTAEEQRLLTLLVEVRSILGMEE